MAHILPVTWPSFPQCTISNYNQADLNINIWYIYIYDIYWYMIVVFPIWLITFDLIFKDSSKCYTPTQKVILEL